MLLIIQEYLRFRKKWFCTVCHLVIWPYGIFFGLVLLFLERGFKYHDDYVSHNVCTVNLTFYLSTDGRKCLLDTDTTFIVLIFQAIYLTMAVLSSLVFLMTLFVVSKTYRHGSSNTIQQCNTFIYESISVLPIIRLSKSIIKFVFYFYKLLFTFPREKMRK